MRRVAFILSVILGANASAEPMLPPSTVPTTAPSSAPASRDGSTIGDVLVDRVQAALAGIDLTPEQRPRVDALLLGVRGQLKDLPAVPAEDRNDTLRQVMADARERLAAILTPAQQAALRDRLQSRPPAAARRPTPGEASSPAAGPTPARRPDDAMTAPRERPDAGAATPSTPTKHPAAARPPGEVNADAPNADATDRGRPGAVGSLAPDFSLLRLKGGVARRASFARRVLVVEFGSYSSPAFRYRSAAMDALAKEYAGRADFLIVYAAEAYPAGDWDVDRNKADDVAVPRHADAAARQAAAERMAAALKPARPVAIDEITDLTAKAFAAGPDGAFVIGRDGTIVARQEWCDPDGLRRHIDAAAARPMPK